PDELCKTEEFRVVQHSIGNDEEFVTVGLRKVSTVERTPGSMSYMYHELFNRKDHGWTVTCRIAHLLEDKQIPSVGVFDEVSFYTLFQALGGNIHDLDSIWEETEQDCNFTRSGFKNRHIVLGDGVTIPGDAVRMYKRRRQETCDGVRM
ncbi:hypothetical protein Tco_1039872, partial [Tanacetum coccineum]